ncbi:hypothetical protein [Phaeobacter sp. C3_T13_0]|uniref:hypothetical protein n=1 Tax=Phaeobacter cretensis TaxID=3342641 RepID=UPI0039BD299F
MTDSGLCNAQLLGGRSDGPAFINRDKRCQQTTAYGDGPVELIGAVSKELTADPGAGYSRSENL